MKDELYDRVMAKGTEYEQIRTEALIGFAIWFWSSVSGGFAHYLEQYPDEWESPRLEIDLVQDDDALWKAIAYCLPYFKYGPSFTTEDYQIRNGQVVVINSHMVDSAKLIQSYPQDELMKAVKLAYDGYFGATPPLTQDPGYREWTERVFDRKPERGHKICPAC